VSEFARCLAPLAGMASAARYKNANVCLTSRDTGTVTICAVYWFWVWRYMLSGAERLNISNCDTRFEILQASLLQNELFWNVTPCLLLD
jgi:hypothetical protein